MPLTEKENTKLASEKKLAIIGKNLWKLFSYPPQKNPRVNIAHILCVSWLTSSSFTIPTFFTSLTKFLPFLKTLVIVGGLIAFINVVDFHGN